MRDYIRLDAEALRVLAHPLRSRVLSQLRLHGPATATELADRLATNTGATSYHLRKLETIGLVADTGDGVGKRRVWQATSRGHSFEPSDFAGDPDAEASLSWLTDHYRSTHLERLERWAEVQRGWPGHWRDALGSGDYGVRVTSEQAVALWRELEAVIDRYHVAGADDPDAIRVLVWTHLLPMDDQPPQEQS